MPGLPPAARLRLASDFAALRGATGRMATHHFLFRWGASTAGHARLGLAVSRKVSKRAVERNRIKRIVRESFRHGRVALPAVDVLVIAHASAASASSQLLRADLNAGWHRLGALKREPVPGTIGG